MSLVEARDLFCVYPGCGWRRRRAAGADARRRRRRDLRRPRPERLGQDDVDAGARRLRAAERRQHRRRRVNLTTLSKGGSPTTAPTTLGYADQHYWRALAGELTAEELSRCRSGSRASRSGPPCARTRAARAGRPSRPRHGRAGRALRRRAATDRALRGPRAPAAPADRRRADRRARRGERGRRLLAARRALTRGGRDGARRQPRPALGCDRRPRRPHPGRARERGAARGRRRRRDRARRLDARPRGGAARGRDRRSGHGDARRRRRRAAAGGRACSARRSMLPDIEGGAGAPVEMRGVTRRYGATSRSMTSRRRSRRAALGRHRPVRIRQVDAARAPRGTRCPGRGRGRDRRPLYVGARPRRARPLPP